MPPEVKLVPVALQSPPTPIVLNDSNSTNTADWQCIRVHESGNRYNDPSAPSGAYGIELSTWRAYGFNGWPYQAAPALQDALALRLYNEYGWAPWSSRYACGL
ncbi:MAG: transglycosylase family protein [Actinobacteria bacterium]|nr:transglycosylase family protein [Actinomycetota bacterium]MCL5444732.1 transglycosylase family protein [Actinomycetota bacterium]